MFEKGNIGTLSLQNRFVRSATAEFAANDEDGTIIEDYFRLYRDLAKGDIGLIIQGHVYVLDEGKAHPGMVGISQDYHLEGLKQLTQCVHESNPLVPIVAQLNHGGWHSVSKKGASFREGKESQVLSEDGIEEIIQVFGQAAIRAKKAGYDAIQIHGAHSYLLSQFLSEKSNRRTDSWGGSLENRAQLLLSVYEEIREKIGNEFPVLVKINGSDDPHEGFTNEESTIVSKWLADKGIDSIEVSGARSTRTINRKNEGYFVANARRIKEAISDTPIISVGGHRTFSQIQKHREDFADFISMARPFIREPDIVRKFRAGKERADCISCSKCMRVEGIIRCANLNNESYNGAKLEKTK